MLQFLCSKYYFEGKAPSLKSDISSAALQFCIYPFCCFPLAPLKSRDDDDGGTFGLLQRPERPDAGARIRDAGRPCRGAPRSHHRGCHCAGQFSALGIIAGVYCTGTDYTNQISLSTTFAQESVGKPVGLYEYTRSSNPNRLVQAPCSRCLAEDTNNYQRQLRRGRCCSRTCEIRISFLLRFCHNGNPPPLFGTWLPCRFRLGCIRRNT